MNRKNYRDGIRSYESFRSFPKNNKNVEVPNETPGPRSSVFRDNFSRDRNFSGLFTRRPFNSPDKNNVICSYGVILFTTFNNKILFQIQQRRDSISYQEFIKDALSPRDMEKHIGMMSKEERARCVEYYLKNDPKSLWDDLWINHKSRIYKNDMERCCKSFPKNMEKYIDYFVDESGGVAENPWGFAKGRKQFNETDSECAFREFEEETGISRDIIERVNIAPYVENYKGSDGKSYRTVLYVAYIPYIPEQNIKNTPNNIRKTYISEEVSQILWCTYEECFGKLSPEKMEILRELNTKLLFDNKNNPINRNISKRRFSF